MGSSKKHKKHKEKDKERGEKRSYDESNFNEQRPLKLVLKVGGGSSTTLGHSSSHHSTPTTSSRSPVKQEQVEPMETDGPPKLTLAYDYQRGEMTSTPSHSSSKKLKKKKSKKKHKKHSHHHHSHHHHSHHRHRSSCSHHSKTSHSQDSTPLPADPTASTSVAPVISSETGIEEVPRPTVTPTVVLQRPRPVKMATKAQFQLFCSPLLKQIQRRDAQEFFAWPVTDLIAPAYSTIIQKPMDFSTLRRKLEQGLYDNIPDFKADVKLMCDNAMLYNQPETIYYKAARKLWHFAKDKIFNRIALAEHKKLFSGIGSYELGFSIDEPYLPMEIEATSPVPLVDAGQQTALTDLPYPILPLSDLTPAALSTAGVEKVDDDELSAIEIIEQAKKAAQGAADRLALLRPHGANLSFLRQRSDGSTSLAVVGAQPEEEREICLGDLVGRLTEGSPYLCSFKELPYNRVRPVETLDCSPFSSYLPSIDSSRANISKEESALLSSTYGDGDEVGLQFSQSILNFAGDNDYVVNMVDGLLDVLTHGQHSKTVVKLKEMPIVEPEVEEVVKEADEIQTDLDDANVLISELESVQKKRLGSSSKPVKPSVEEETIATKLSTKLTQLISNYATPVDITDIRSIRKAMGITLKGD